MKKIDPTSLKKPENIDPAMDFDTLRAQGINALQQLAGDTWTEYNLSDPGVTILEQLCYAITELAYRTEFSVSDLLAGQDNIIDLKANAFYTKKEILTTSPITAMDYKKALIDTFAEVHNAWVLPSSRVINQVVYNGIYRVLIQLEDPDGNGDLTRAEYQAGIRQRIHKYLSSQRNLCENFEEISILEPEKIKIYADIKVGGNISSEKLLASVYQAIDSYFNSHLRYYSEHELLAKGYTIEEIYQGPALQGGFLQDSDFQQWRTEIDLTEIMTLITQLPDVIGVQNLAIGKGDEKPDSKPLIISSDKYPSLDVGTDNTTAGNTIKLLKDNYTLVIRPKAFRDAWLEIKEKAKGRLVNLTKQTDQTGTYRNPAEYQSIQHQFPIYYGLGQHGLYASASESRKAKGKQLKAYLMFFEQMFANYFAQLANLENIFSIKLGEIPKHTYFTQIPDSVPGMDDIITYYTDGGEERDYLYYLEKISETESEYFDRKNRVFDHLLARFDEEVSKHQAVIFEKNYGNSYDDLRSKELLQWKADLLNRYAEISYNRAKGFDYTEPVWDTENMSGLELKAALVLGIRPTVKKLMFEVFNRAESTLNPATHKWSSADFLSINRKMNWMQGELNVTDFRQAGFGEGKPEQEPEYQFFFVNKTMAQINNILKEGIDPANFLVGPDSLNQQWMLIYNPGNDNDWFTVSRHPDMRTARKALKHVTAQIRDISIQSEGFHIVEHVLLRPSYTEAAFGFSISGKKQGEIYLKQHEVTNHAARTETIDKLLSAGTKTEQYKISQFGSQYHVDLVYNNEILASSSVMYDTMDEANEAIRNTIYIIQNVIDLGYNEGLRLTIHFPENEVIDESFFNFTATVFLPGWPARFQDEEFTAYIKSVFQKEVAAHIRLNFKVLNIIRMRDFEMIYADWLHSLKAGQASGKKASVSEKLIRFIRHGKHS